MPRMLSLFVIAFAILWAQTAFAREAGWVPVSREPYKPPYKSGVPKAKQKAVRTPQVKKGATVYDRQPPVTEAELGAFIALLPRFRDWARQNHEEAHPIVNPDGQADFAYSPKAADWLASQGFAPARFFCVMGRMAAGVVIIEEGNDMQGARPKDMPVVDQQEIALARRHLGELLTAAAGN